VRRKEECSSLYLRDGLSDCSPLADPNPAHQARQAAQHASISEFQPGLPDRSTVESTKITEQEGMKMIILKGRKRRQDVKYEKMGTL